jgi:hypothetical protein
MTAVNVRNGPNVDLIGLHEPSIAGAALRSRVEPSHRAGECFSSRARVDPQAVTGCGRPNSLFHIAKDMIAGLDRAVAIDAASHLHRKRYRGIFVPRIGS